MKMALIYDISKCLVAEKKPDGAVEIGSSSFFVVPLSSLCQVLQICESSLAQYVDTGGIKSILFLHDWVFNKEVLF